MILINVFRLYHIMFFFCCCLTKSLLCSTPLFFPLFTIGQNTYQIAILKYNGGGDWYANPTALPNLIAFSNENIGTNIKKEPATVEVGSSDIFNYPFLHMTGHGNVVLILVKQKIYATIF